MILYTRVCIIIITLSWLLVMIYCIIIIIKQVDTRVGMIPSSITRDRMHVLEGRTATVYMHEITLHSTAQNSTRNTELVQHRRAQQSGTTTCFFVRRLAGACHFLSPASPSCEHCNPRVGRTPWRERPFTFHDAVVGFFGRCQTWKCLFFAIGGIDKFCRLLSAHPRPNIFNETPGRRPPHIASRRVETVTVGWVGAPNERAALIFDRQSLVLSNDVCQGLGISRTRLFTPMLYMGNISWGIKL